MIEKYNLVNSICQLYTVNNMGHPFTRLVQTANPKGYCFYPKEKEWYNCVPADFVFAVKANRYLTHMKKLKYQKESFKKFFQSLEPFGEKCGP